jgi:hypothetical protein
LPSLGEDFLFVHNPITNQELDKDWMKRGRSVWVEDNQLRFKKNGESA